VTLCGEESAGTGSDHVREKDGLWAVLLWLNILAETGLSAKDLLMQHWETYGRNYYSRHDYEAVDALNAEAMMNALRSKLSSLPGQTFDAGVVQSADEFAYDDPIDLSRSEGQGIRIVFDGGSRIVFRLSGTGTVGATLRVYLEAYENHSDKLQVSVETALSDIISSAQQIAGIREATGRTKPDVTT